MAIFTGGVIPTINVSSNTLLNQATTGIAGNLADTTLSVALSPVLGAELSNSLGLDPNATLDLGQVVSNGVVGVGQTYLNQVINEEIVNSDALGPFGPLVGGLAQNAASALTQGISGLLTGQGLSGFGAGGQATASAPNNVPSQAFPGAGDEPYGDAEAQYEGNVYNLGSGGPDVTFSIKLATTGAAAAGLSEIANPTASYTTALGQSIPGLGSLDVPASASLNSVASNFSDVAASFPSAAVGTSGVGGLTQTAASAIGSSLGGSGVPSAAAGVLTNAFGANSTAASLTSAATTFASGGAASLGIPAISSTLPSIPVGGLLGAAGSLGGLESLTSNPLGSALSAASPEPSTVWNFIVAPEEISWDLQVATQRVDIFGTNSPPVTVGTKGMRNLSLGNALIEGFTRARTVEGRVIALENLLKFTLNSKGGFVNVPVYQVFANEKIYGDSNGQDGGYFVFSDIRVKETMRDLTGKSTRAYADISMVQVPKYQVNTGRDQASKALSAASATGLQGGPTASTGANQGVGTSVPASGQGTPPPPAPPTVSPAFAPPPVA